MSTFYIQKRAKMFSFVHSKFVITGGIQFEFGESDDVAEFGTVENSTSILDDAWKGLKNKIAGQLS